MSKKEIQKRRMMSYFIEATNHIIEEEGLEAVTVRKVADIAGYNSATLYNYFENLDHLIFFASMKYVKEYSEALPCYLKGVETAFDKYVAIWRCFCYYSFSKPKIYHAIFFDAYSDYIRDSVKEYYEIFPEDLVAESEELLSMFLEKNIYERNISILKSCVKEGFIEEKDLYDINKMTYLIYYGMLCKILNNKDLYTVDEAVEMTLKYIKKTIQCYSTCL
ncbi:TetR/AcrR family transcriptional regulator [Natronincola ferrireducens]|uniref:Transcriptional regulator, TetR family n=1 Tax=Natronincola ferrireducens TaxID=393762 RepID=A0A1G8ZGP7_9FIRM|nr:TetR/AcrR family transcriptional regulator [Natronincola ferrireducens]SDK14163.1 transcriptional regulator, TetR family [Natronincola ferrireducens]